MSNRRRRKAAAILTLAVSGVAAVSASGAVITVFGTNGGPNQPGADANAVANSSDPQNTANATGGTGSLVFPGRPGGAASATATTSQNLSSADATANATGGVGGLGAAGGSATVSASALNASQNQVTVIGRATGGTGGYNAGGNAGAGGFAQLGLLYGASTGGGSVFVSGTATGGAGGNSNNNSNAPGRGGQAIAINAVDGDTIGALSLIQIANGGGFGSSDGVAFPLGGGSAYTQLDLSKNVGSLDVTLGASGGLSLAYAVGNITNVAGNVTLNVSASGDSRAFTPTIPAGYAFGNASVGDAHDVTVHSAATGADARLNGINARAEANTLSHGGAAVATADASGGTSQFAQGTGDASAIATARTSGNGAASASANSTGGPPGSGLPNGGPGGSGFATASAYSDFGPASASVLTINSSTNDAQLINAVSGSTGGMLTLVQTALGSQGHASTSILNATNPGGGGISAFVTAQSGTGFFAQPTPGGNTFVSSSLTAAGSVSLTATATAAPFVRGTETLSYAGQGMATLGRVYGLSTGGNAVTITGSATGGNAFTNNGTGGDGAPAYAINAVDGDTTGALSLSEFTFGGGGGFGNAAPAYSSLSGNKSAASLAVDVEATAGGGGGGAISPTATASAIMMNSTGPMTMKVIATGGIGSGSGGSASGGLGTAIAMGTAVASLSVAATANGGDGYPGPLVAHYTGKASGTGPASSFAQGTLIGPGTLNVSSIANGGKGGIASGGAFRSSDGSTATASAFAVMGDGALSIDVLQRGGAGGNSNNTAAGGNGAPSFLIDAISATASGSVVFTHRAIAGSGGDAKQFGAPTTATGGTGAAALSTLTLSLPLATSVSGTVSAVAGNGGFGDPGGDLNAGSGATARAGAQITGGGPVNLVVFATGGNGGESGFGIAGNGASATLAPTVGTSLSASGVVTVLGTASGGNSGGGFSQGTSGLAGSISLVDALDGNTGILGTLNLTQIATAGSAHGPNGHQPAAGTASSSLSRVKDVSLLRMETRAAGGGGPTSVFGANINVGGSSSASTSAGIAAGNTSGTPQAFSTATGGAGGSLSPLKSGNGGSAWANSVATGGAGWIGKAATADARASGGNGGSSLSGAAFGSAGIGGAATANVSADSSGVMLVNATATGGLGGNGNSVGGSQFHDTGGDGGNASATGNAHGSANAQSDTFAMTVTAIGGAGGTGNKTPTPGQNFGGMGGNAFAQATGTYVTQSPAEVSIVATAIGGAPGDRRFGGSARAISSGTTTAPGPSAPSSFAALPSSATAKVEASSTSFFGGVVTQVQSKASAPGVAIDRVESQTLVGGLLPLASMAGADQAAAFAVAMPDSEDFSNTLTGNPNSQAALSSVAFNLGLGLLAASSPTSGPAGDYSYHSEEKYILNRGRLASGSVLLALLNSATTGTINSVHLHVDFGGNSAFDQTAPDAASAVALFSDHVIDLGNPVAPAGSLIDLTISMDVTTSQSGGSFLAETATSNVPEPAGGLVLLGAFGILSRRRRRSSETSLQRSG